MTRSPRFRSGLLLAVAAVAVSGCGGGTAAPHRAVAAATSAPSESPAVSPTMTTITKPSLGPAVPAPADTPTPALTAVGQVGPAGPMAPRFSPATAFDAATGVLLLFGGVSGMTYLADTWAWDGQRWTQLQPAHSPRARSGAEMAYDELHQQVVLFGGNGAPGLNLADTWLWNGADWTQAAPAFSPAPTVGEGMTFFAGTGTVLLYSGNGMGANHVYSWDGSNWTDLLFTGGPPGLESQGGFSVDPQRQVVVFLADDINKRTLQHWEFDGRRWTHRDVLTPPERGDVQTATDKRTGTIVMFGGSGRNDTWTWDGTAWTQQYPAHTPSARAGGGPEPGVAFDAVVGRIVIFGGRGDGPDLSDTWTWDGVDWSSR